jgi:hypothetical protein
MDLRYRLAGIDLPARGRPYGPPGADVRVSTIGYRSAGVVAAGVASAASTLAGGIRWLRSNSASFRLDRGLAGSAKAWPLGNARADLA